jgi:hypothetical protein
LASVYTALDTALYELRIRKRGCEGFDLIGYRGQPEANELSGKDVPSDSDRGRNNAARGTGLSFAQERSDGELHLHAFGAGTADEGTDRVSEEEAAQAQKGELEVGDGEAEPGGGVEYGLRLIAGR